MDATTVGGTCCNSVTAKYFPLEHEDLVNDISFDNYGKRFVSCSSDHTVKVWDSDNNGSWKLSSRWKSHNGVILKAIWADARFGQIIATCSDDRTVVVWEETEPTKDESSRWAKRCCFIDNKDSVCHIAFGPKRLGLLLAACSRDGVFRIYETPNIMDLTQWCVQHELIFSCGLRCFSWSDSLSLGSCIALGFDQVFVADIMTKTAGGNDVRKISESIAIIDYNEHTRKWDRRPPDASLNCVSFSNDLSFAPTLGRGYHLLAIATTTLKIWKIFPRFKDTQVQEKPIEIMDFKDHITNVSRVSWSLTGACLTSSSSDGSVKCWRQNSQSEWHCFFNIQNDNSHFLFKLKDFEKEDFSSDFPIVTPANIPTSMW